MKSYADFQNYFFIGLLSITFHPSMFAQVKAFVELSLSSSVRSGAAQLARLAGLGAMKPDTVLLGFRDTATPTDFFRE